MILAFNEQVACEPFSHTGAEATVQKGFATVKQREELVPLKVVYGGLEGIGAGSVVWVKGESVKAHWAVQEYLVDDRVVILVPKAAIQLVDADRDYSESMVCCDGA